MIWFKHCSFCRVKQQLHNRIISLKGEVLIHITSLIQPRFIEVPVKSGKWAVMYTCVGAIDFVSVSMVIRLDFVTFQTERHFLFIDFIYSFIHYSHQRKDWRYQRGNQKIPKGFSLNIFYLLKYAKRIRHKLNKLMKSSPTYNKLQHYLIEHAFIWIFLTLICVNWWRTENEERN